MTAVEKIKSEFYSYAEPYNGFSEESKWTISEKDFEKLIEQALEMEEEQMKKSFSDGAQWELYGSDLTYEERAEQYYNITFKQK